MIMDANNRYVYMSGTYNSFNVSDSQPESGYLWTAVESTDGTVTIKNIETNKYISYDVDYSSFGAYSEPSENQKDDLMLAVYVKPEGDSGEDAGNGEDDTIETLEVKNGTYVIYAAFNASMNTDDKEFFNLERYDFGTRKDNTAEQRSLCESHGCAG